MLDQTRSWSESGGGKVRAVGVYEAKTQLPRLVERVRRGERITITRHGVPVALLVPPGRPRRRPVADVVEELSTFSTGRQLGASLRRVVAAGRR
jgi:prevent-host-death family protein